MRKDSALDEYRSVGVDAAIATASPHQLVMMLFQGARAALAIARTALEQRAPARARDALAKAMAIIDDGLNASLDTARGGDMAQRLRSLYNYMIGRLSEARRAQDPAPIAEVDRLLADLEESWREIPRRPNGGYGAPPPQRSGPVSYGKA